MKLLPLILALAATTSGLVARDANEGGEGLVAQHTGSEFERSDSVAGAIIEDPTSSDPEAIFGLAVCPSGHPYYCSNGNFCCPNGHPWCCVIGATKFCCPSGYPYCGRDLRCYKN
ncbi:hypothetical protein HJFPF1_13131 [Paramyrothecium foliicola]|nr:hypothetical protein HJFPF1_13131 [Paramyrothecium foliicola]